MNSKKGGSIASNHVHRLLKGDCKKGGKRTRTKRSKSKKRKVVKKKTTRKTGKRSKSGKKRSKSRRKTKSNKMRGGVISCDDKNIFKDVNSCRDLLQSSLPPDIKTALNKCCKKKFPNANFPENIDLPGHTLVNFP